MAQSSRPLCADISRAAGEPLGATASRIDHWLLVEYPGRWSRDVLGGSMLPAGVKEHLQEELASLSHARLLFIRRPERRGATERHVYAVRSGPSTSAAYRVPLEGPGDLAAIDVAAVLGGSGEKVDHPLLVVCTHGKRDRCCSLYGRPLYDALRRVAAPEWVWQSTHVGGDRFAGNLVCLPEGLYFGRVGPGEAWSVLDEYLSGRVQLDLYRGRSCYSFPVQAAERAVREATGLGGVDDLELVSAEPIRFRAGRRLYEVEVAPETGELTYLTCRSGNLRHPQRFAAGSLREQAV
jgi:hypothetical protein